MFRSNRSVKKNLNFARSTFFFHRAILPSLIGGGGEAKTTTVIDRHGWSMFQRSLKLMTRDTMSTWRQEEGGGGDETLENAGEENTRFFFPRPSLPVCLALYSILRIRRNGKKNRDINRPFHPNDQSSINNLRTRTFDPGLIPNTTRTQLG